MKMMFTKLKVFMLLAVCACGLGAKAETVTVDFTQQGYTNGKAATDVSSGDVTIVFSAGTHTSGQAPAYYDKGTAVRFYVGNTLTVSVPEGGELIQINFTCGDGKATVGSVSAGTYSNGVWTGSGVNSVIFNFNVKDAFRLQKMEVTYTTGGGETPTIAVPEISLPTGSYVGEQTVTITAEEGASVYYTTNGDAPTAESTEYTTPIPVSETTTIKAIAVKGGESSSVATSVITIVPEVKSIAAFIKAGTKAALTLTNAVVTARNATNVYIQDETGALLIYGTVPDCAIGDKVSGTMIGEYSEYKDHGHQMLNGDFSGAKFTPGGELLPEEVTLAELIAEPELYHMHLVKVVGCTYDNSQISQGSETVKFYDSLRLLPSDYVWPALFDFTGIFLNYYGSTPELIARSAEDIVNKSSLEVPEFAWSATSVVYDMNNPTDLPTLTNTSDATPVYTSSSEAVATVATDGKITIIGEGKTTITAEVAATENYSAATASFTLEVVNTEAQGDAVAFVASMLDGTAYAMSTASPKSGVLGAVEVQTVNGKVINAANQAELSWYVDKSAGTIQTASGAYLTATSKATDLSTATKKCVWTWDDAEGIFVQGTRSFFYSEGTGFKNYATSNENNKGYSGLSQMMTFADGHVRTGLTAEDWGTICLPNAVAAGDVTGADFYPVAGKVVTDGKVTAIVLGEAVTTLEAGVPYVFSAKEASLLAAYSGEAVSAPVAANGLTGTLAAINADKNAEDTELSGKYMLVGNTWRLCGKGCSLAANRAYLDMDAVPSLAAGSYALTMSVFDDGATGIESVDATASAPVDVYTVSGVRVRASVSSAQATEGLQKGLYIINGKKVLVK